MCPSGQLSVCNMRGNLAATVGGDLGCHILQPCVAHPDVRLWRAGYVHSDNSGGTTVEQHGVTSAVAGSVHPGYQDLYESRIG